MYFRESICFYVQKLGFLLSLLVSACCQRLLKLVSIKSERNQAIIKQVAKNGTTGSSFLWQWMCLHQTIKQYFLFVLEYKYQYLTKKGLKYQYQYFSEKVLSIRYNTFSNTFVVKNLGFHREAETFVVVGQQFIVQNSRNSTMNKLLISTLLHYNITRSEI